MSSPASPNRPPPPAINAHDAPRDPFDTPLFHRLLGLIEKQNDTIDEQKKTLSEHGTKLDALVNDARKDDLPYDEEQDPIGNEQLWSGVYEIASAKMKEEAEEWKGLMDVSLVFIAIFLAVLTAFLVPAAQALNPSPGIRTPSNSTSSPPPLPPQSDQNVCAFYYLSLIMAMCNAVLCVLGRQWVGKLLSRPSGKTHRERTMRYEARKKLAYGWIKPLVAVLYWSLLFSIGLFIAGLLYQLRNLSISFDQTTPVLETTWGLGIVLAAMLIATIAATTIHAIRFESSPFEGILSGFVVKIVRRSEKRWKWINKYRVSVDWNSLKGGGALFKTYMEIIAEANDPKLLDRVAPSFSYFAWVKCGEGAMETLERAYNRLMASDTSTRVRETVRAQISRFAKICREDPWLVRDELGKNDLSNFLHDRYSLPSQFPAWATIASFSKNNRDLHDIGALPVDKCIAQILCTYDQNRQLGYRRQIFEAAVHHCRSLLAQGNEDDVVRILSHVVRLSFVRSYMRAPDLWFNVSNDFLTFLVRDSRAEILIHVNEFLEDPPSNVNHYHVFHILFALLYPEPARPLGIDLSPVIAFVTHRLHQSFWAQISDSLVLYLGECDLSALSDPTAVLQLLQLCVDPDSLDEDGNRLLTTEETRTRARDILNTLQAQGIPLPPSCPSFPSLSRDGALPNDPLFAEMSSKSPPAMIELQAVQSWDGPSRRLSTSSVHIEMATLKQ
ncbi:hypothetical protein SISNIDRAFT_464583 [Sistotremastrum niveocremeum HHB9708]|uniref:DUF6535 domain-containing protein n=1 Tax=Sistotremastrum niveocremeum HHB9708 TaxID=1314777 RepID=A0A164X2S7_9AGAM|nr:hypothetical protein SISNIDRAFT_464583 [Sistotremastrum niveocremeum HHB9708]